MTHSYLPQPYCHFNEMRNRVYYHLYPEAQADIELKDVVSKRIEWANVATEELRRHLSELNLDPEDQTNWYWGKAHGVTDTRRLGPGVRAIFNNASSARELLSFSLQLERAGFNVASCFFPQPTDSPRLASFPSVPEEVKPLRKARFRKFLDTARDALYRGRMTAHIKSHEGINAIEDRNIWLDDGVATNALRTGRIDYSPRKFRTSLGTLEMIFDGDELGAQFPPLNNVNATSDETKKSLPEKIADALMCLHPDGIPEAAYGEISELKHKIETMTGIDVISGGTWQRGKKIYQERLLGI